MIVTILYHPGSITEYLTIINDIKKDEKSILVLCEHDYTTDEIKNHLLSLFDDIVVLSNINYDYRIPLGIIRIRQHQAKLKKLFDTYPVKKIKIITDISAYLPVNTALSYFMKNFEVQEIFSVKANLKHEYKPDFKKTFFASIYSKLCGLLKAQYFEKLGYIYTNEIDCKVVKILPFFSLPIAKSDKKIFFKKKNLYQLGDMEKKDTILIFSDKDLSPYDPPEDKIYHKKLGEFYREIQKKYPNASILCKPHPADGMEGMEGMQCLKYDFYQKEITSQLAIDELHSRLIACYSPASTSLIYSSSVGIPSYTFYKFLNLKASILAEYFENDLQKENPCLINIERLEQIGSIDTNQMKEQP
ncbi:MAG: hypothetical protein HOE90_11370 [Bacteriovoracaceae bacterium]|jgi:hypothetical protein|nr:hypothetical protein [Bacteriovoracaceae bacterium]